ncbi:MAG TPA: hypothetical protein VEA99_07920 [Gemmatimonadaceae bacterium]|nr:hypothetical protein [Gemmatimonadaceae bacterium]
MYYALYCDFPRSPTDGYLDIDDGIDIEGVESWSSGQRFAAPPRAPIVVTCTPEGEAEGPPREMHDANLLLMSDRLVAALRGAGVDNIDTYPATLVHAQTGERWPYQAVNIIGLVRAADLGKSVWTNHDGEALFDTSFESLAVDERAARGQLLFRLAENTGTILAHERVRDHIIASGIDTIRFIEPENWVRI